MRRRTPRHRLALAVAAATAFVTACSHDGRTLRPPAPGQTVPPSVSSTTGQLPAGSQTGQQVTPGVMVLSSPSFASGGAIPDVYTCKGADISPPLVWSGVPKNAVELAITVTDDDANGFVHWVVANIDPSTRSLAEGAVPEAAVQSVNDSHTTGWSGPCPPAGETHHYVFSLYALDRPSGVQQSAEPLKAIATVAGLAELSARLTAIYRGS